MCGLAGVISHELSPGDIDVFEDLMLVSTLRGGDGSGVIGVPKNMSSPYSTVKSAGRGSEVTFTKEYRDFNFGKKKYTALLGHTRYRTSGGLTREFSHPLESKHIVGMMNGTMSVVNGKDMKKEFDAAHMIRSVADVGLHQTIQKSEGPACLVYIHKGERTLNFYRTKHRPLYFAYPETHMDTIFWASELRFLELVLSRSLNDKFKVVGLPEHEHWRFDLYTKRTVIQLKDNTSFMDCRLKEQEAEKKKEEAARKVWQDKEAQKLLALPAPAYGSVVVPKNEDGSDAQHTTRAGSMVSSTELERLLIAGCANCSQPASYHDYIYGKLHWHQPRDFVCEPCYDDDETARQVVDEANGKMST